MKKTVFWLVCIVALIAIGIGAYLAWFYWIHPLQVQEFSLKDYSYELASFPSDLAVEPIEDAADAREKACSVLVNVFGEEKINNQKPLMTCYDKDSDTWLVYGTLSPLTLGGTAHIIINAEDGAVLAIWHTK